jgi:hypothetical protein
MVKTQMVCLGLSRKNNNFCLAGYDIQNKRVIRPVTDSTNRCITAKQCTLDNGKQLEVLDIIELSLLQHTPLGCQQENYIIDPSVQWKYIGKYNKTKLDAFVDTPSILWHNNDSSYYGLNDKIPANIADTCFTQSIYFLKLNQLDIVVQYEGITTGFPYKKIRGRFTYNNVTYTLSITDTAIEPLAKAKECGTYTLQGPLYAGISLGEIFNGYRYKILASIIQM